MRVIVFTIASQVCERAIYRMQLKKGILNAVEPLRTIIESIKLCLFENAKFRFYFVCWE